MMPVCRRNSRIFQNSFIKTRHLCSLAFANFFIRSLGSLMILATLLSSEGQDHRLYYTALMCKLLFREGRR